MNNNMMRIMAENRGMVQAVTLCSLLFFFGAGAAFAEPAAKNDSPVAVVLSFKKVVVDAKGKETLADAPRVQPGELVEYTAVYRNRSKQDITGLNASLPVPVGLEYVDNSAKPTRVEATVDNAKYAPIPLVRTVKNAAGKEQRVNVPFAEYRGLRWTIDKLAAGKKVEVSARMRVIELAKSPEELVKKPATGGNVGVQPFAKPTP